VCGPTLIVGEKFLTGFWCRGLMCVGFYETFFQDLVRSLY